jgi:hypothetical protein
MAMAVRMSPQLIHQRIYSFTLIHLRGYKGCCLPVDGGTEKTRDETRWLRQYEKGNRAHENQIPS